MQTEVDLNKIVKSAVAGDQQSRDQLVRLVAPRLRAYVFRSTLDSDLTNDLLQEVYCKMLSSLETLRNVSSFWAWLYRIASNCINSYFRKKSKQKLVTNYQDDLLETLVEDPRSVEARLMSKELGHAVMEAVAALKPKHRQIVNLRCFENMTFKEISQVEQTNEVYTRILFYRSIEKLRILLKKQGFQKVSLMLALTMFGRLTATSQAAALTTTVNASAIGIGVSKEALATKIIKTASTVSVHHVKVSAVIIAVSTVITTIMTVGPFRGGVTSAHYVIQGVQPVVDQATNTAQIQQQQSISSSFSSSVVADRAHIHYQTKGAYENMLYMPQGPEGPIMRFMQRWNMEQDSKMCSWLQDGSGNYYYNSGEKKIYVTNDPLRMLILPTDKPDFVDFIFSQVGYDSRLSYKHRFLTGLLKTSLDNRVPDYPDYKCEYAYNSLLLDDLKVNWPNTDNVEDLRDPMHKRGWTYFEVHGRINDKVVTGCGRIPFVFDMYQEHLPWISLQIGKERCTDYPGSIAMAELEQNTILYENETFFEGFCRPWEGLPCIDSVRRDAAKYHMRFTTDDQGNQAIVTIFMDAGGSRIAIVYDIDRETDVIRSIKFQRGRYVFGELYFEYIQDASTADVEVFQEPQTDIISGDEDRPDILWLSLLVAQS